MIILPQPGPASSSTYVEKGVHHNQDCHKSFFFNINKVTFDICYWLQKEISAALLMTFSFLPLELSILEISIDPLQKVSDSVVPSSMWSQRQRLHRYKRQKHVHIFAFVHAQVHCSTVCTCVYLIYIVLSAVALKNAGDRLQFHSAFQSWSPHGWWGGDRWTSPYKSILNVCVNVMFLTSLVTLFIFLFVFLLLLATITKLKHI